MVDPYSDESGTALEHLLRFSRALHDAGMPVNTAKLIDLGQSFEYIDIGQQEDFYAAARATLVTNQRDLPLFDQVFNQYWLRLQELHIQPRKGERQEDEHEDQKTTTRIATQRREEEPEQEESAEKKTELAYSPDAALLERDLGTLSREEIERARQLIAELVALIANYKSRRHTRDVRRRRIDFRRTLRRNALLEQSAVQLMYRSQRLKKNRLLLLCDVSGSMERYSSFLIQFIYALRAEVPDLEVGVFSTRMTMITEQLKTRSVEESLQRVSDSVHDWAGGTDIGASLREFNDRFARDMLRSRAVVIVLSDGWDRGDAYLMREEMEHLHRRVHKLLWLNPLLGFKDYQPLTRGMQTALPFIDYFLPAHSLESLARMARVLRTIWR